MQLKLELELKRSECLHGESLGLLLKLTNVGKKPAENILTFEPRNEAVRLLVGTRHEGDRLGRLKRESTGPRLIHYHRKRMTLQPGQAVVCTGDLLDWVGALSVGEHRLRAEYDPGDAAGSPNVSSLELDLKVLAVTPTYASRPRLGEVGQMAPFPVLWREKSGKDGVWLAHQHSRVLPPNPYSAPRIAELPPDVEPIIAGVIPPWPMWGHACWLDKNTINVLPFSYYGMSKGKPISIPAEFSKPVLLESPCTIIEQQAALLYSDAESKELRLVTIGEKGKASTWRLPLGDASPFEQYCAAWLFDRRLALAWTTSGSKKLHFATAPLADPTEAFVPKDVAVIGGSVLRVDVGAIHRDPPSAAPDFRIGAAEPAEDPNAEEDWKDPGVDDLETLSSFTIYALLAERQPRRLSIAAYSAQTGQERILARIPIPDTITGDLTVFDSVMRQRRHPAYLVKDAQDRLYYCSTQVRHLISLEAFAGEDVRPSEFPCLIASSARADVDWIYLRYMSRKGRAFQYAKIEPENQADRYGLTKQRAVTLRWY